MTETEPTSVRDRPAPPLLSFVVAGVALVPTGWWTERVVEGLTINWDAATAESGAPDDWSQALGRLLLIGIEALVVVWLFNRAPQQIPRYSTQVNSSLGTFTLAAGGFLAVFTTLDWLRTKIDLDSTGLGASHPGLPNIVSSALAGPLEELFFLAMIVGGATYLATRPDLPPRWQRALLVAAVIVSAGGRSCIHVYQGPIGWVPALIWGGAAAAYFAFVDRSLPTLLGIIGAHSYTNTILGISASTDSNPQLTLAVTATLLTGLGSLAILFTHNTKTEQEPTK